MSPMDNAFLTVQEVATLARVSKMTIYRLVRNGTLPSTRIGRSVRIPEADACNYLGIMNRIDKFLADPSTGVQRTRPTR